MRSTAMVAMFLFCAVSAFAQELGDEVNPVQVHNGIVRMDYLDGFYVPDLKVKGTNTDIAGMEFSGAAARVGITAGYGFYGLDPVRLRVYGTAGVEPMMLKWDSNGTNQFVDDTGEDSKTLAFTKGLEPSFGVGAEIEYRYGDVMLDVGSYWKSASAKAKKDTFDSQDEERLSYRLLNVTATLGWQATFWLKPYAGIRYSRLDMTYRHHLTTFEFDPGPPATIVQVERHARIDFELKKNLNYVLGFDFGGAGLTSFRLEGWFGDVYGGMLSLKFEFSSEARRA